MRVRFSSLARSFTFNEALESPSPCHTLQTLCAVVAQSPVRDEETALSALNRRPAKQPLLFMLTRNHLFPSACAL